MLRLCLEVAIDCSCNHSGGFLVFAEHTGLGDWLTACCVHRFQVVFAGFRFCFCFAVDSPSAFGWIWMRSGSVSSCYDCYAFMCYGFDCVTMR